MVVAVDVGGTTTRLALVSGDELRGRTVLATVRGEGLGNALGAAIADLVAREGVPKSEVAAVGVSIPGPLDADRRRVVFTGNVSLFDYALADHLERIVGLPVVMDDDANCAALGEVERGAALGARVAVLIVVGTGIGAGIVVDGRLYRGAHSVAGEVGHINLDPAGPRCSCGDYGCFEALASGSALADRGRAAVRQGTAPLLSDLAGDDLNAIDAETVVEAAAQGDAGAVAALEVTGGYLARGIAAVANAFDPDVIVLGGGLGRTAAMLEWARRGVKEHCIAPIDRLVRVETALLGDDAGLWGAGLLARGRAG
jgi:glucokinase